jgi:hypothetical protein
VLLCSGRGSGFEIPNVLALEAVSELARVRYLNTNGIHSAALSADSTRTDLIQQLHQLPISKKFTETQVLFDLVETNLGRKN